jgi:hypothetical protein
MTVSLFIYSCCTMAGDPGMERGVVGYSYPDSEQLAEWSKVCDRGGVYWKEKKMVRLSVLSPRCARRVVVVALHEGWTHRDSSR